MSDDDDYDPSLISTEPSLTVGSITAAATAIIGLVVAFLPGLLDDTQQKAILVVVAVVAPFIVGAVVRGKVTPWPPPRRARD